MELNNDYTKALGSLTWYLAKRDHSRQELFTKLSRRYTTTVIEQVLQAAEERGWLCPPEQLAQRVVERLNRQKKGWKYICQYLKRKGLPLPPKDEDLEEEKAGLLLKAKVQMQCLNELTFLERQKLGVYLANRGFEEVIIRKVLNGR